MVSPAREAIGQVLDTGTRLTINAAKKRGQAVERRLINTGKSVQIEAILDGNEHDEAVIFVPGLGARADQFIDQVAFFSDLYRTVAVSLRGHGRSTYPIPPEPPDFSLENLALDLQRLTDQIGVTSAHIVGNSTGGLAGYALLATAPEKVRSLTTFGTAAELHTGLLGRVVVWVDRLLGPGGDAWLAARTVSKNPATAAKVAEMIRSTPKPALVNLRRNLLDYDFLPVLRDHPDVPVLLLQGEEDHGINRVLKTTLDALEDQANGKIERIPEAGHFLNLDQPDAFNRTLLEFLKNATRKDMTS